MIDDTRVIQGYFPLQVNVPQWDHAEIYETCFSSSSSFRAHDEDLPNGTAGAAG
jgi:hypothetical protein